MIRLKILVACEESQAVTSRLRNLGHEAWSCDLLPSSGPCPEYHLQQDVTVLLRQRRDVIIAFPPCTYLTVSGNRWFNVGNYGAKAIKRHYDRAKAIEFFMLFANADCDHIAVENPIGTMSTYFRKPDQIIQPWQFGHGETKATCLWLKGLPCLEPTNVVEGREQNIWLMADEDGKKLGWNTLEIKVARSKTFPGIADAMATQWVDHVVELKEMML